jgi:hypothetical protein
LYRLDRLAAAPDDVTYGVARHLHLVDGLAAASAAELTDVETAGTAATASAVTLEKIRGHSNIILRHFCTFSNTLLTLTLTRALTGFTGFLQEV